MGYGIVLEVQKYLRNHKLEDLKNEYGIKYTLYDDRVVLNYSQINTPGGKKFHPIIRECRALILSYPDYKIISRSFDRFYNYKEDPDSDNFDISKAIIKEKVDGSLVNIYHDKTKWCVSTKGTAFAEGNIFNTSYVFKDLIFEALNIRTDNDFQNFMSSCNDTKEYTYIFELVSPKNRIIKIYDKTELIYLATRDKYSGEYIFKFEDICFLHEFYKFHTKLFKRAKLYKLSSFDEIINTFNKLSYQEEGYVAYIPEENWRIKIKNPVHVAS